MQLNGLGVLQFSRVFLLVLKIYNCHLGDSGKWPFWGGGGVNTILIFLGGGGGMENCFLDAYCGLHIHTSNTIRKIY